MNLQKKMIDADCTRKNKNNNIQNSGIIKNNRKQKIRRLESWKNKGFLYG